MTADAFTLLGLSLLAAAALGGLAIWLFARRSGAKSTAASPVPGEARAPPQNPAAASSPGTLPEARLLLKAMIAAAVCDGVLDDSERTKIERQATRVQGPISRFTKEVSSPWSMQQLKEACAGAPQRTQVYRASLFTISAHSAPEREYLRELADVLGLSPQTVGAVHRKLGRAPA